MTTLYWQRERVNKMYLSACAEYLLAAWELLADRAPQRKWALNTFVDGLLFYAGDLFLLKNFFSNWLILRLTVGAMEIQYSKSMASNFLPDSQFKRNVDRKMLAILVVDGR